jgi:pyruvate kinase
MQLDSAVETFKDRKTKIVCTLGPSSSSPAQIRDLLLSGLDVARINCAHGDRASYAALVDSLRSASDEVRRGGLRSVDDVSRPDVGVAALAFDIKGPEIRVGRFSPAVPLNSSGSRQIPLHRGERILLCTSPALADAGSKQGGIYVAYPLLAQHVRPGSRIYIDDGNVELQVVSCDQAAGTVVAVSLTDSPLLERKGVNLPGVTVELPHVTRKDEADMATARALGADFVFASFVQSGAMVREIRSALGPGIGIISKIESQVRPARRGRQLAAGAACNAAAGLASTAPQPRESSRPLPPSLPS